jgi:DnaJ-class molecular chaperone
MVKENKKVICSHCRGNGYIKHEYTEFVYQCKVCKSEGEYVVRDPETAKLHNASYLSSIGLN